MKSVRVRPAAEWWIVEADGITAPMIFRTGSSAEKAARQLALACTRFDAGSVMEIETRGGRVYRFLCFLDGANSPPRFIELCGRSH